MLFSITSKHIELEESFKDYAREKTSKFPRYYSGVNQTEVIVDGGEGSHSGDVSVEIIARGEHSNVFVCTETDPDVLKAFDAAVHKVERQLRRKKEKERNNKHISGG